MELIVAGVAYLLGGYLTEKDVEILPHDAESAAFVTSLRACVVVAWPVYILVKTYGKLFPEQAVGFYPEDTYEDEGDE